MRLYHITPAYNAPSVAVHGLRVSKATKAPRVWLLTEGRMAWAYPHLCQHHDLPADTKFVGYEVNVPNSWMRKSGRRGVWYTTHDIDPVRMQRVGLEIAAKYRWMEY